MLSDFQTLVTSLHRDDDNQVSADQRDQAIAAAVLKYSKDRPLSVVVTVISDGGQVLPMPGDWKAGFSVLQGIEFPTGKIPASMLPNDEFEIRRTPFGDQINTRYSFKANDEAWLHITKAHDVTALLDTVPDQDREPVCCFAAASICDQLAALYSGDTDSTINADSVSHQSKAGEFASRARSLRKRYFEELGVSNNRTQGASVVVNLNQNDSRGRDRLTHSNRYR